MKTYTVATETKRRFFIDVLAKDVKDALSKAREAWDSGEEFELGIEDIPNSDNMDFEVL